MNKGADIQHKVTATAPGGFAFEAGQLVPVVSPDDVADEPPQESPPRLDAAQLLDLILDSAPDNAAIAANALILAMLLKRPTAPATLTELSARLDVPRTTARRIWTAVLLCLQAKLKVFGH